MSKKLQEKQARRLAEERRLSQKKKEARRRNLITMTITVVVFAGAVLLIVNERKKEGGPIEGSVAASEAGCTDVESFEPMESPHIEVGAPHEPYNSDPPTSGPHYQSPDGPVDPSYYTNELEPEQVVHNLEHGQVVIWYRPDLDAEMKDRIERLAEQESTATVALPYEGIDDKHSFVLTAWGNKRSCAKVSQAVVDDFRTQFQGKAGPEARLTKPFDA